MLFAEVLSTPPTQAVLEFLEEDGILAVPGSKANAWHAEPFLVPQGTSYEYDAINIADWFVNESGLTTGADVYCAIHVNDKYGQDTLIGIEFAAEQLGFELAEIQTLARGDTAYTAQITAMSDAGCTVVFTVGLPTEQNSMLAEASAQGFEPYWLASLPSFINLFGAGQRRPVHEVLHHPRHAGVLRRFGAGHGRLQRAVGRLRPGEPQHLPAGRLLPAVLGACAARAGRRARRPRS